MLFKYYILQESMSNYKNKKNICFYHSFYLYLKQYYNNIISFEQFLQFKNTNDYFISIQEFLNEYNLLYKYLIKFDKNIKNILNNLILGIAKLENNKANIIGFIKLDKNNKHNYILNNVLKYTDKPIILLNHNEHFDPIVLQI